MVLNLYPHFFGLLFLFIIAIRIFICPFSDYIYKTIWTDLNTLSHLIQAFSKNSLGLFSDFRVSCLTSISLSFSQQMCNSNVILHSSGMGQSFWPSSELWNEWFSTYSTNFPLHQLWVLCQSPTSTAIKSDILMMVMLSQN